MDNKEAIEKAIDSTILANGGKLNPEQSKKFIDFMEETATLLKSGEIQFKRMETPEAKLDLIGISKRIIRAANEGVAPTKTAVIDTAQRSLTVKEVILPIELTYTFLKENIEKEDAEDHIIKMFATQFTNDLEDLAINGDTQAQNTDNTQPHYYDVSEGEIAFLRIFDGWLQLILADPNKHIVDTSGKEWKDVFKAALASLPRKYKARKTGLRFYVAPNVEEEYRYLLAARQTELGDKLLTENKTTTFMGIPIVPIPSMPDDHILLTMPKNLAFGILKNEISIEKDKDIMRRVKQYVITADVGVQIVTADAAVLAYPVS